VALGGVLVLAGIVDEAALTWAVAELAISTTWVCRAEMVFW
jgi:hypothetical protein